MKLPARALIALVCVAAAVPAPSSAAVERCGGKVATMVISKASAKQATGTPRDDVIVIHRRIAFVDAGAGDDLVCVRSRNGLALVDGEAGDDMIRVEGDTVTSARIDEGTDTFVGGPGTDIVVTGEAGVRNRDRISLGGGDDQLNLAHGTDHTLARTSGGSGRDSLALTPMRRGSLSVDASRQRAMLGGRRFASWSGFESYELSGTGRQTFVGTEGDDTVWFGSWHSSARTLGGDDVVTVDGAFELRRTPDVDGGDGTDTLGVRLSHVTSVVASLVTDRVDVTYGPELGDESIGFSITGFEGLDVSATPLVADRPSRVEVIGDDGPNSLTGEGCSVVLRGGAGDDDLRVGHDAFDSYVIIRPRPQACRATSEVYGEAGDDVLVSRAWNYTRRGVVELPVRDLLDGGEGTDTADAGRGTDTCLAETRVSCEA